MKSQSTRRTRVSATRASTRSLFLANMVTSALVLPAATNAYAQQPVCPSFLLRPEVVRRLIDDPIGRFGKSTGRISSDKVADTITHDLKRQISMYLPRDLMQLVRPQISEIDRAMVEACYPQVTAYLHQVDIASGLTDDVRVQASEAWRRRQSKVQEDAVSRERESNEQQVATRERLELLKAENEANKLALERRIREGDERQRVEAAQRETDVENVKRDKATADRTRRLRTSYRNMLLFQACYDSLKGASKVFATQGQLGEAHALIATIEEKAFSADPRLDKDAIYSSAKQEEDRLANDPTQIGATARGNIMRQTYDDGSKAFCDAQLIALRNAASAVGTAF